MSTTNEVRDFQEGREESIGRLLSHEERTKRRVEAARKSVRDMMTDAPEKFVEVLVDEMNNRMEILLRRVNNLSEEITKLRAHRHVDGEVVVPLKHNWGGPVQELGKQHSVTPAWVEIFERAAGGNY